MPARRDKSTNLPERRKRGAEIGHAPVRILPAWSDVEARLRNLYGLVSDIRPDIQYTGGLSLHVGDLTGAGCNVWRGRRFALSTLITSGAATMYTLEAGAQDIVIDELAVQVFPVGIALEAYIQGPVTTALGGGQAVWTERLQRDVTTGERAPVSGFNGAVAPLGTIFWRGQSTQNHQFVTEDIHLSAGSKIFLTTSALITYGVVNVRGKIF